jgi:signal transduction histidine kinase/HAMP domain-containing protein
MRFPLVARRLHIQESIGAKIFGAFIAMGLITGMLGGFGYYVLSSAGGFVEATYDGPLQAIDFARAASLVFTQMDKELLHRRLVAPEGHPAVDAKIEELGKSFFEDLAVAEERSRSAEARAAIAEIRAGVIEWNEMRLATEASESIANLDAIAEKIVERFDRLIEATVDHSYVERRKAVAAVASFKYITIGSTAMALLLACAITLFLARRIVKPLATAAEIADRIAGGALATPIPAGGADETGMLLRSMTIMRDNIRDMVEREQQQRRSAQSRLLHALESSHEGLLLVDAEGRIVLANSQVARYFPPSAPKIAAGAIFAEVFAEIRRHLVTAIASAGTEPLAWERLLASGGEFQIAGDRWLRASRSATQDGGFFLVFSDFTAIKEREHHLSVAKQEAEEASAAKSNFLANMSHELRTPLNAIIGFSEVMSGEVFGPMGNPKYREYVASILDSGRHLLDIINGLLDLAKSDAGKLQLEGEPLELRRIIEACAGIMREQCVRGEISLEITPIENALTVWGDAAKLRQIALNLLSNAVKFTEPGGRVSISASKGEPGFVDLIIGDTGIGMKAEDIPNALKPFSQIDSRLARRYAGTGLGLPLTKALVDLHGGKMHIESAPGRGTTVIVRLLEYSRELEERALAGAGG